MTYPTQLSLDGEWQFWTDGEPNNLYSVPVPAPWQATPALREYAGVGWYRREVDLPPTWFEEGRVVRLHVGAADYFAEVQLNGIPVAAHEGGYLPFSCDVTDAARPGPNTLIVRVSDPPDVFPDIPHGKQSWYGMLSGLWQSVWMESRPATYIRDLRLVPQGEEVHVEARLSREPAAGTLLRYEILAPSGDLVTVLESESHQVTLHVLDPLPWHPDTPWLYTLRVTLSGAGFSDSDVRSFGFRTVEARDGRLWLNGRPLYLRAALDQDYYPDLISTPPSEAFLEEQFRKAKAMGLNCLRVHIKIADPRYYAAADRVGLLIWTELPNTQRLTPDSRRRLRETLTGMVARDGHHPSIILWTIINESWGIDLTDPEQRAWLAETYDYLKGLDPSRPVVGNSACRGNFHVVTDVEDFHNYYAIPDHYDQWRAWTEKFAGRPRWSFAHAYTTHAEWQSFLADPWSDHPRPLASEVRRQGDEPLIVSEFGNWGLPDIAGLLNEDGTEPWWFETGLEWGNGVVYPHGVQARYAQYHLRRVFPAFADFVAASQRLEYAALKYEIEQIRRHASLAGYVITEFTDVHWECNGLLDMRRNFKHFSLAMREINNDDVIIPTWERLAYWSGERCALDLAVSHFSAEELHAGYLTWQLEGYPALSGTCARFTPEPLNVTGAGTVTFVMPDVERPARLRLVLHLHKNDGRVIGVQHQEFFVFPRREVPTTVKVYAPKFAAQLRTLGYTLVECAESADVVVADVLTDALRAYMLQGGRVLWLAESDQALQTNLGTFEVAPRRDRDWQGDWASSVSWIYKDHLFGTLPTAGEVDFLFVDLTPEHVLMGLSPHDFARDVHAALAVGWLHKTVGLVAERRVGAGRLLASTFRLGNRLATHPVAAAMFCDMVSWLASDRSSFEGTG